MGDCVQGDDHVPDWETLRFGDYAATQGTVEEGVIVDVTCVRCPRIGSFTVTDRTVNWVCERRGVRE